MRFRAGALLTIFLLLQQLAAVCQNLVPNPGFENLLSVPAFAGEWNLAQPWQGLNATPDLYSRTSPGPGLQPCDNVKIPINAGGFCNERQNLNAYIGLQFDLINGYREYLTVPLTVPLNAGEIYRLEFYVQRADSSRFACNRMGLLLTNNIPVQPGTGTISFIPQLEANNVITDASNWTLVTGVYEATGGENYATIGLFRSDTDPQLSKNDNGPKLSGCIDIDNSAYYYFDDIVVRPIDVNFEILGDTIICPNQSTVLEANSNVPFFWSVSPTPNDTLSTDNSITITPFQPTTYYLNTFYGIDSVTVTIVQPPLVDLGPDTLLCEEDSIPLDATAQDAILYNWSSGDTTAFIYAKDTGTYIVTVDNSGCSVIDSIRIPAYLDNPSISLGEDSLYCFFYNDTLKLDAGDALSYLWLPTLQTSREITILRPDYYSVTVTRPNGCIRAAGMEVAEVCEPLVWVPTAFTPDGDGINDIIRAYANNIDRFDFRIVNRFGQTVFFTEDPLEGWDGTYEGSESPFGVYVYRINIRGLDTEGIKVKRKIFGTITLIR